MEVREGLLINGFVNFIIFDMGEVFSVGMKGYCGIVLMWNFGILV